MRVKVELKTPSSLENVFLNVHQWCSCSATKAETVGLFPEEDATEGSWVGGLQAVMRVVLARVTCVSVAEGTGLQTLLLLSGFLWS